MRGLVYILALFLSPITIKAEAIGVCEANDDLLPNPSDCSSFIQCDNGVARVIECPPGLQFNAEALICDLPQNVNCIVTDGPTSTKSTTSQSTTERETTTAEVTTAKQTTEGTKPTTKEPVTTTTEANVCPPTGTIIVPNPESCSSFLVCVNGRAGVVECPPGWLFNSNLNECDREENVICGDNTTPPQNNNTSPTSTTGKPTIQPTTIPAPLCPPSGTTIVPNPASCSSFLVCINGNSTVIECPTGLLFNPQSNSCENRTNVSCGDESTTTEENWTTTNNEITTENVETTTPSIGPQCPAEGYEILANPDDCSSFWVCVNGLSALIHCPDGLFFNNSTFKCETDVKGCNAGSPTLPTEAPTTEGPFVPDCPQHGIIQLPNPYDCNKFYICIDSLYTELRCPNNFSFDFKSQSCTPKAESDCKGLLVDLYEFVCPKDGSFVDPEDCGRYYVCVGGTPIHMDCPGNLYFDENSGTCMNRDEVICNAGSSQKPTSTDGTTPSTVSPTDSTETPTDPTMTSTTSTSRPTTGNPGSGVQCPPTGTSKVPNPDDCGSFYVCIEGEHALVPCPDGYLYDPVLENCNLAENVTCNIDTSPSCPPQGIAVLPNPRDCKSYFLCINGLYDLIVCGDGLEFNSLTGFCDTPENAHCSIGTTSSTPKPSTGSPNTSEGTPNSTFSPTTDQPTTVSSSPKPPTSAPGECTTGELLPNPDNCSTFFLCDNGIPFEIECPSGLLFNPKTKVCDTPDNVDCTTSHFDRLKKLLRFLF